jgi:hypothetical protein
MKNILAPVLIISFLWVEAQTMQMAPASLNFGTVLETDRDSFQISLANSAPRDVGVRGVYLPTFYGSSPYFLHSLPAQIPAQGSSSFWIGLKVEHNIDHSSGLIIDTDSFYGSFVCPIQAVGRYSNSYYNSTNDLEGTALFQALRNRISSPYTDLGYTSARDQMYASIDNSNGQVECAYTGRTASFSTRSGANSNNFNCEHTFPQSPVFNRTETHLWTIRHSSTAWVLMRRTVRSLQKAGRSIRTRCTCASAQRPMSSSRAGAIARPRSS